MFIFVCILAMVSSPAVLTSAENNLHCQYTVLTFVAFPVGLTVAELCHGCAYVRCNRMCIYSEYRRSLYAAIVCND